MSCMCKSSFASQKWKKIAESQQGGNRFTQILNTRLLKSVTNVEKTPANGVDVDQNLGCEILDTNAGFIHIILRFMCDCI